MQDKKVLVLIILTVLAIISLVYGITASAKRPVGSDATAAQTVSLLPAKGDTGVERQAKRTKFISWKRSPFVPPASASAAQLVLSGIIWHKDKPKAMIGDAILMKGDKIAGNTVVDIKPDRVILNDGTKDFELKIEK